ncbi:ABC transporter ATP-binding protein [Lysobacter korlensis]|uniref:ABC transporter ATP-binding protein n=1 Tax=Lysobacter korlensis TaxID=553636 RepID=A0ABV6RXI3_9GAMM
MTQPTAASSSTPAAASGLRVDGLTVSVNGRTLVDQATFAAPAGKVTALIGPNGAGKTSAIRAITGATRPDSGVMELDGASLIRMRRRERARRVALVEQDAASVLPLTVAAVVGLGRIPHEAAFTSSSARDATIVDECLQIVGMEKFADRSFDTLSGGERQRVHFARALAQEPRLLVLDEPTNHLDLAAQLRALEVLRTRAAGGTVVLAALHDLNLVAAFCDRVVVLAAGRVLAEGDVEDVLDAQLIEGVYGVSATVLRSPDSGRPLFEFQSRLPGPARSPIPTV